MDYYASYKNSKAPSLLRKELVSYAQRMALSCFAATVLFLDMENGYVIFFYRLQCNYRPVCSLCTLRSKINGGEKMNSRDVQYR